MAQALLLDRAFKSTDLNYIPDCRCLKLHQESIYNPWYTFYSYLDIFYSHQKKKKKPKNSCIRQSLFQTLSYSRFSLLLNLLHVQKLQQCLIHKGVQDHRIIAVKTQWLQPCISFYLFFHLPVFLSTKLLTLVQTLSLPLWHLSCYAFYNI